MAINKGTIKNQILAKWSSAKMGEQDLNALIGVIVDAVIDEIKNNAEFTGTVTSGACTHSGTHPPVIVKGFPGCLK